jgi:(2Fe-2S) ferredoxin
MHESERLVQLVERTIAADPSLQGRAVVRSYTCFGRCDDGPNLFVQELRPSDDVEADPDLDVLEQQRGFYPGMDETKILRVLAGHCGADQVVADLVDDY